MVEDPAAETMSENEVVPGQTLGENACIKLYLWMIKIIHIYA